MKNWILYLNSMNVLDAGITFAATRKYGMWIELNPLPQQFGFDYFVIFKLAMVTIVTLLCYYLYKSNVFKDIKIFDPKKAFVAVMAILGLFLTLVVLWNSYFVSTL